MLRDMPTRKMNGFLSHDGYLFRFRKLCISRTSLRDFLFWKLHAGGLAGHFDQNKTIETVDVRFYWPNLKRDVAKIVGQCSHLSTSQATKHIALLTLSFLYPIAIDKT